MINKWLNSTYYFDAEGKGNGGKSAAELEREKINVVSTNDEVKEEEKEVEEEEVEEKEVEKEEEKEEESEEEKEVEVSAEDKDKELEKLRKQVERLNKRVGKTSGERDTIKKELREAKAALEAKVKDGEQPLTEEEVERRSEEKATQKALEKEFNDAQTRLAKAAIKADKDFMKKINELAEEVAPIPGAMVGMLDDLDHENGGAVLAYLANNPEEFEEIHTLPIVKMARRLDKISDKLAEEAKVKPKPVSKVPKPLEPVGGNTSNTNNSMILTGKESMEEFVRKRNLQVEERRKMKMR